MQGFAVINLSISELGTYITVSWFERVSDKESVFRWDHRIEVAPDTEVPEAELAQWQSNMARVCSRYFEDRLIEHIRTSVSKTDVAVE
jgi:hypothetical protein